MSRYSTVEDIQDATGTKLDTVVIDRLIGSADRKIKTRLITENLNYIFVTIPDEILEASIHYTAALIMNRHMVDGTLPASQSIPGASASVEALDVRNQHTEIADKWLQDYIDRVGDKTNNRAYHVVGELGERTGEYREMTTDEQEDN